ncbi:MAG: hypothetical protein IT463_01125 [Planctomycetes bacterium]|nr:hypothetical protein [Planctomycetota bacterium]
MSRKLAAVGIAVAIVVVAAVVSRRVADDGNAPTLSRAGSSLPGGDHASAPTSSMQAGVPMAGNAAGVQTPETTLGSAIPAGNDAGALEADNAEGDDCEPYTIRPSETREQWLDREIAQEKSRLDELIQRVFGEAPRNPIQALADLPEDQLIGLLGERGDGIFPTATEVGFLIGSALPPEEWLAWFEESGPRSGAGGRVAIEILGSAISKVGNSWWEDLHGRSVRTDAALARRTLAILDGYLTSWRGQALGDEVTALGSALKEICPVEGGLDLIQKWVVVTPHGDEIVEMTLCELLILWPLAEARSTAVDVLASAGGGAIKGCVRCWQEAKRGSRSAWKRAETQEFLEAPLAEAVAKTSSSAAILYADLFAGDLLELRSREVAAALLDRRDSVYCTALAFSFLKRADLHAAQATWLQWITADDEYRLLAACNAATGLPDVAKDQPVLDRFQSLSLDTVRTSAVRAEAALALYQLERDLGRCKLVLSAWLNQSELPDSMLRAAGRLILWVPEAEAKAFLHARATELERGPFELRHEMLLLTTVDPRAALALCESRENRRRFDDYTRMLVAAAAEAMNMDLAPQCARLRESCIEAEPLWMKNVRQRVSGDDDPTEARVVGYARVRPK